MTVDKLPTRMQLIAALISWFIIWWGLQCFVIFQIFNNINFAFIDASISLGLTLIGISIIYFVQKYSGSYINNYGTRFFFIIAIIAGIIFSERLILTGLYSGSDFETMFNTTITIRLVAAFLQITFFSAVLWFLYFVKVQNEKNSLKFDAETTLRQAELIKLRQQLQPHFLFNSLNSINALVVSEPQQARKMIQNLSDFLRGTLKKDENKNVPFSEEINLLKLYLEIEKVRFGHRLAVNFNISEDTLNLKLPPLLLQPIVENAVKFGLYNVLNQVEISVNAHVKNNLLAIVITNPFDESTAQSMKGEGFGLSLIQKRLHLIYHRTDLLVIEKNNSIFTTIILIPQA
ncbi:MAG: histidine kinase [Bacteroidetes bacterium]|nr:histidine kinase [Bacteroidota bacterium]